MSTRTFFTETFLTDDHRGGLNSSSWQSASAPDLSHCPAASTRLLAHLLPLPCSTPGQSVKASLTNTITHVLCADLGGAPGTVPQTKYFPPLYSSIVLPQAFFYLLGTQVSCLFDKAFLNFSTCN